MCNVPQDKDHACRSQSPITTRDGDPPAAIARHWSANLPNAATDCFSLATGPIQKPRRLPALGLESRPSWTLREMQGLTLRKALPHATAEMGLPPIL